MNDQPSPPPPTAETLLRAAVRAVRSGNRPAARAILRLTTRHYPHDVRAWMGLTDAAEHDEERLAALEQVVALAPDNERARKAVERLRAAVAPTHTVVAETAVQEANAPTIATEPVAMRAPAYAPEDEATAVEEQAHEERRRTGWVWPLAAVVLLVIAAVACLALVIPSWFTNSVSSGGPSPQQEATVPLQSPESAGVVPSALPTGELPLAVGTPVVSAGQPTTATTGATPFATTVITSTARPLGAQRATSTPIPAGALLEIDNWRASLARPDRLLALDGAVGDVQPQGRLILALVSLANMGDQPRRPPSDLFVLIDEQGETYRPVPALSTIYLAAYGRGLRGDLSLEDEMPTGGYFSVPVLFDVPPDARGLRLSLGDGSVGGWEMPPAP